MIIYLIKIGLALLLGIFVGYEREIQKKSAGFRDVTLVTLGATLFTIISLELALIAQKISGGDIRYDIGRIIAYTIASMGFLGSGAIIQNKNKLEGITTAGVLWSMVACGLAIGLGNYQLAIITALAIYLVLKLKYIKIKFHSMRKRRKK